jgi:RNA recognition motif-containing protein
LNNWLCVVYWPPTLLWAGGFLIPVKPEKAVKMNVLLYIRNLARLTTEDELRTLFSEVGEVTALKIIKDRVSGESKGFGFITMSAQSEADKAVSRFNAYTLAGHVLRVNLAKPRVQRGLSDPVFEP